MQSWRSPGIIIEYLERKKERKKDRKGEREKQRVKRESESECLYETRKGVIENPKQLFQFNVSQITFVCVFYLQVLLSLVKVAQTHNYYS